MVVLQNYSIRQFQKNPEEEDYFIESPLQLHNYFSAKEPQPITTTTTTTKKMKTSIVKDHQKIAKTKLPSSLPPPNMNGQSIRTRKDKSMKPDIISAAQHLLQLCAENLNNKTGNEEEDEVKYHRSHQMSFFDKFKVQEGEEGKKGSGDDEEIKSDVSYITDDDSSDMEITTLADISAAQQIMQLSSNSTQQAAEDEDEDEEEATMYNTARPTSSDIVSSIRKDFEGSNVFLPRKRKFRSLADLYQITQPLEDDS